MLAFFIIKDIFTPHISIKEISNSPDHAALKDSSSSCMERDCELGMFAKGSSVKLIILSDNESRAPQG